MISRRAEFKLLDRGFSENLVLIPGWATDYRIFDRLDLDYNYLLPVKFHLFDFEDRLLEFLEQESLDKISLFGWSLGGFLAVEFASRNPTRVRELNLAGIQKGFSQKQLKEVKLGLRKNKRARLYKFYLDCFSDKESEGLSWFRKCLLKNYLEEMEAGDLVAGLDYLSRARIEPAAFSGIKRVRIFHGRKDKIASLAEVCRIESELPQAKLICLSGAGHLCFLNREFRDKFQHG